MTYPMRLAALVLTVAALSLATGHWLGEQSKARFGSIGGVGAEPAAPVLMSAASQEEETGILTP